MAGGALRDLVIPALLGLLPLVAAAFVILRIARRGRR